MKNFITNTGAKNLKERLLELILNSKELKFLVGFFYYSGIKELYKALKENQNVILKVLVGLNVDKINDKLVELADSENLSSRSSNEVIFKKFIDSLKNSINSETFDTQEFYNQSKFFNELINNNRLIIRKTIDPNHAKLYIFKPKSGQVGRDRLFITASIL